MTTVKSDKMIAKQVSVFLENKSGRLNEVTSILSANNINISAFTVADTSEFGVLRLMVSDPEKAVEVLRSNRFSARLTDVVLINSPNIPGSLDNALKVLTSEDVFIEYMYAFSVSQKKAIIVIRPSDTEKCIEVLNRHRIELISKDHLYEV